MTNKNFFSVDFFARTISGTKASFNKASKGNGPAYEELASLTAKHPEFKLAIKEPKKHTTKAKRTYNGMDFPFMEAYIETRSNAKQLMKDYKAVKKMAETVGISVYPFTKKWFLGEFDPNGEGFDMDAAKKAISDYRMEKAILGVNEATATDEEQASSNVVELPAVANM